MASKIQIPPKSLGRQLNFTTGRLNALCEKKLAAHDLTLPQWVVLSCLWRDGPLTVGTLATLAGTGLPATSRLIDRMADRGLVARRRATSDARVTVVEATQAGQALDHLAAFYQEINDTLCADFSEAERAQAFDLLTRMEANATAALAK